LSKVTEVIILCTLLLNTLRLAERDRLERDMADLSTARVDQFRREVINSRTERDAALRLRNIDKASK
jgi:hypothetical protein